MFYVFDKQHPALPVRILDHGRDEARILGNVPKGYTVGEEANGRRLVARPNGSVMLAIVRVPKALPMAKQMEIRRELDRAWPVSL